MPGAQIFKLCWTAPLPALSEAAALQGLDQEAARKAPGRRVLHGNGGMMDVLRPMRPARGLQLWNSETHSAFSFPDLEDRPGRAPGSWRSRVGAPEAAALAMASRNQLADKTGLLPPKPRNHAEVHRIHAESPSQPKTSEINPSFTKEFGDISARQQTRADLTGSSCGVKRERERV